MDDNLELLHDRYARALYEQAAQDKNIDRVMHELNSLSELWLSDGNFREFLIHPFITRQEKKAVMTQIIKKKKYCRTILNFIKVIIDNNRESLIHGIFLRYREICESGEDKLSVVVESAKKLSYNEKQQIKKALNIKLAKDVHLEVKVNPDLIAGLHFRYGDEIFNNNLDVKLDSLKEVIV